MFLTVNDFANIYTVLIFDLFKGEFNSAGYSFLAEELLREVLELP